MSPRTGRDGGTRQSRPALPQGGLSRVNGAPPTVPHRAAFPGSRTIPLCPPGISPTVPAGENVKEFRRRVHLFRERPLSLTPRHIKGSGLHLDEKPRIQAEGEVPSEARRRGSDAQKRGVARRARRGVLRGGVFEIAGVAAIRRPSAGGCAVGRRSLQSLWIRAPVEGRVVWGISGALHTMDRGRGR